MEPAGKRPDHTADRNATSEGDRIVQRDGDRDGGTTSRIGGVELRALALRVRHTVLIAAIAWPLFGLMDWFIVAFVQPGRLWVYLLARAVGLAPLLYGVVRLHGDREPRRGELLFLDTFLSTSASVCLTVTTIEFGGIASPISIGVILVLVVRGAVITDHWRRGIVPIGSVALAFPATLAILAFISPQVAAQFANSRALAGFAMYLLFIWAAAAITLVGGHLNWALRRQIFEARALGRYRLERRIGSGAMGEVWSARHHALKRDVAVKILRPDSISNATAVQRFEREVRAMCELSHPNTVRIFDYGNTEDGLWYYAMELLEGVNLRRLVAREGHLSPRRALRLLLQASRAIAEAHARGLIHRDIKPENLFVTSIGGEGEFIKVLDFGLVKRSGGAEDSGLTRAGFAMGTPNYISPETLLGREADARSDVYALGGVLYFMLCGSPPFDFSDVQKTYAAHLRTRPTLPSDRLGRVIPHELEMVAMRCLEKDPAHRYQSAADLAHALARLARAAERRRSSLRRAAASPPPLPPAPLGVPLPTLPRTFDGDTELDFDAPQFG